MDIKSYIESGILEGYILNAISDDDRASVEKMLSIHKEVRDELLLIEKSLEVYTTESSLTPPSHIKENILDEIERESLLKSPPILTQHSKISDYDLWLNKIKAPKEYNNMHMEVIGDYDDAKMVIAWVKDGEPNHLHTEYTESFLIVEGACTATINGVTSDFTVGDYASFPINQFHSYKVTSKIPMKVIACLNLNAA